METATALTAAAASPAHSLFAPAFKSFPGGIGQAAVNLLSAYEGHAYLCIRWVTAQTFEFYLLTDSDDRAAMSAEAASDKTASLGWTISGTPQSIDSRRYAWSGTDDEGTTDLYLNGGSPGSIPYLTLQELINHALDGNFSEAVGSTPALFPFPGVMAIDQFNGVIHTGQSNMISYITFLAPIPDATFSVAVKSPWE